MCLQIFHLVVHFLRIEDFPQQHEVMQEVAEGLPLVAIGDTGMGDALLMQPKEIRVMRHEDATGGVGIGQMRVVVRAFQSRLQRGRHVNGAAAQPLRDAGMNMLIEVKFDRPKHGAG